MKILFAVDGSQSSLRAAQDLIRLARGCRAKPRIELVAVHAPLPKLPRMRLVVGSKQIQAYYREEGEAMLARARRKLSAARLAYRSQVLVGPVAETIVRHAQASGCDLILIGSRGMGALGAAVLGSTATKVLQLSRLPVLVGK